MNDDELLERLGAALLPDPQASPPGSGLAALHAAIDARAAAPPSRRRLRRLGVGAVIAVSLGASGAAFAAIAGLPGPVRSLAHELGLPVDSSDLVDAKDHRDGLRMAVLRSDAPAAARFAELLRTELPRLAGDERRQIEPEVADLLRKADPLAAGASPAPGGAQPSDTQQGGSSRQQGGGSQQQGADGDRSSSQPRLNDVAGPSSTAPPTSLPPASAPAGDPPPTDTAVVDPQSTATDAASSGANQSSGATNASAGQP